MIKNVGEAQSSVAAFICFLRRILTCFKGGVRRSEAGEVEEPYWLGQVDGCS